MSFDAAELFLRHEQSGANPTFPLITSVPALNVTANSFDDGESRFDHVGAGQRQPQLLGNMQPVNGQRFLQPFGQTARRTRIEVHELLMQSIERLFGA